MFLQMLLQMLLQMYRMSNIYTSKAEQAAAAVWNDPEVQQLVWNMFVDSVRQYENKDL